MERLEKSVFMNVMKCSEVLPKRTNFVPSLPTSMYSPYCPLQSLHRLPGTSLSHLLEPAELEDSITCPKELE